MTMYGFSNIQFSNAAFAQDSAAVVATKAAFKAGGTSLRNRKKNANAAQAAPAEEANPWANLGSDEASGQINEDALMADAQAVDAMTTTFAAEGDRIMPGKPCADCSCGQKEIYDAAVAAAGGAVEALETG